MSQALRPLVVRLLSKLLPRKHMLRLISIIAIIFFIFNQWFWLAGFCTFVYLSRFSSFEIVIVGMLLDGYFGAFEVVPMFTIFCFLTWVLAEIIKGKLLMYTEPNETFS